MSILHCKPSPWRGQSVLDNSKRFGQSLEAALSHLANGQSLNFPLFEGLRKEIHSELESHSGVVYHPSDRLAKLDYEKFRSVFEAFCLWLGVPAPINKSGDYIKEVSDAGVRDSINAPQRGHMTNQELAFHCDRADITVLCCWSTAEQGGEFRLRSSSDVITGVEKKHPHLKNLLRRPIPHDLRGEGDESFCHLPLLVDEENSFVFRYIRKFNDSVVRHGVELPEGVQSLLDSVEAEINEDNAYAEVVFQKGTLVLLNNHTTLHMRTDFKDSAANRRCLLRCWLGSEFTRPLPESFRPIFHSVDAGDPRGGVK
ncbi:TauD/TfdA family dioxygenase [Pseudomonas lijiangensis]|uniref:TauD/TfdA family dioxygenase n=1 Tax=Pseudomonas lijiangensis TaxID=2995658 RepID=UPI0031BB6A8B